MVNVIAFSADGQGVSSTEQASYILGLPPGTRLDRDLIKSRFRQLSRVFHPDRPTGDTERMSPVDRGRPVSRGEIAAAVRHSSP